MRVLDPSHPNDDPTHTGATTRKPWMALILRPLLLTTYDRGEPAVSYR